MQARLQVQLTGDSKGRVERAIGYVRTSFWPARRWRDVDDLNAQAEAWCLGEASERPWPDDKRKTVAAASAEEQPRLLSLPANTYSTEEVVTVKVGKTPHVRFRGNDYSVPHTLVRRAVEIRATLLSVRVIVDGAVVAEHARSFDRGFVSEDPAHVEALRKSKGEARKHRALDRLAQAVPSSQQVFVKLAEQGENIGRATQYFVGLLDQYGAMALEQAMREALAGGTANYNAVRCNLERARIASGQPPSTPVDLPDDERVRGLAIPPRDLRRYDELFDANKEVDHDAAS